MATVTMRNGIDVQKLGDLAETIKRQPGHAQFRFRAQSQWTGGTRCVSHIKEFWQQGKPNPGRNRSFELASDEPELLCGQDGAPNAVEMLLSALSSCLSVGYAANAAVMGIELESLELDLTGDVDLRGFLGLSDRVRPGIQNLRVKVAVKSKASRNDLEKLRAQVERTSPVIDCLANPVPVITSLAVAS